MRDRAIMATLLGMAVFAILGSIFIFWWAPPAPSRTKVPVSDKARRVVLQDRAEDDDLRAATFVGLLREIGRCDYVTRALMRAPGVWRVSCAPGYAYRLAFDENLRLYDVGRDN